MMLLAGWKIQQHNHSSYSVVIFIPVLQLKESKEEEVAVNFLELIQNLLKDPEERQDFFSVRQYC